MSNPAKQTIGSNTKGPFIVAVKPVIQRYGFSEPNRSENPDADEFGYETADR
jgi:hypothetical protein